jgi:hypothetical protein
MVPTSTGERIVEMGKQEFDLTLVIPLSVFSFAHLISASRPRVLICMTTTNAGDDVR